MRCPACRSALEPQEAGGIRLDVCRDGCGGVWFDRFELKKLDEPHEPVPDDLVNRERNEASPVDRTRRRTCPRCQDLVMMRHYFSVREEVEVDECPGCGGVWLDQGELRKIRSLFRSEEERDRAARERFADLFDAKLHRARAQSLGERERARRFARLFRYICPSFYVPGKQRWGAF